MSVAATIPCEVYESDGDCLSENMSASTELVSASDMTDITSHVEIRDGSIQIAYGSVNPTTVSLLRCKKQIVIPFYKLLGIIAWRPFGGMPYQGFTLMKIVNVIYPIVIVVLLLFSYVTSVLACRGESKRVPSRRNVTNGSILTPPTINTTPKDVWDPAYNECKHIFGTFILPSMFHLLAYCIGFYLYRIKQHEGLYVLMEKVFLQSPQQTRLHITLRLFVILGIIWLLLDLGVFVLFIFAFGPGTVTGFRDNADSSLWRRAVIAIFMVAGLLVLDLVNVVIIVNYTAQCQLVIHYMRGIKQRIEEKSTTLVGAMKDILDVKDTLQRMNSLLSFMVSLCTLTLIEGAIVGMIYVITDGHQTNKIIAYRLTQIFIYIVALFFPVVQAARVTTLSSRFKQISLDVRVFGHQTSSQLELDSFLVFVQSADLKARLFFSPVRSGFLSGLVLVFLFTLLVLVQTGAIAYDTKLF